MSSHDATSIEDSGTLRVHSTDLHRLSSESVRSLYEAHSKEVYAFLVGVLRNNHDATEVTQITFRRLLESGQTARHETLKGWIFKVAMNEALMWKRNSAREDKRLKDYASAQQEASLLPATDFTAIRQEEIHRLKQLLSQLPEDQQFVVKQRIYEAKTFAVIATELNVPVGTVLTRMRLALEKLRKWLGND